LSPKPSRTPLIHKGIKNSGRCGFLFYAMSKNTWIETKVGCTGTPYSNIEIMDRLLQEMFTFWVYDFYVFAASFNYLPFKVKIGCLQYVADLDYLNMILKC
jgi:hypothetical protein